MMNKFVVINILTICLVLELSFSNALPGTIEFTKHNLSVSGPGIIKAATEDEICIFCHVPHEIGRAHV